jgi:predicted metalloprotease with PDZ domain
MARTSYRLSFPQPHTHLIDVDARYAELSGDSVELRMAAWTPGSYLVRDYARHVQELVAESESGRALVVTKVDKATWRVSLAGAHEVRVRYRVFAHELTVRTSHVDATHAFVNGAPTFLWIEARAGEPHAVRVDAPAGWTVVGGPAAGVTAWEAADLDELLDTPIHAGPGPVVAIEAAGRTADLTTWGRFDEPAAISTEQLAADTGKIMDAYARLFGGVPYDRYAFLLMLAPNAHGGLEHKRSCALLGSSYAFTARKKYEDLLELVSHEYFHLWNVKRIRPRVLGPFDYGRENYTRSLWVAEGITSYYDRYTLRRARLMGGKRYLEKLAEEWGSLLAVPGRRRQSVEESSYDAWIKLYRPDENSANSTVSYYLKGAVVALCLDLEIRRRSGGRRSLDDVMVRLWREYGERDRGFADGDVQLEMERAVDLDLGSFFERCVRGREDPDLEGVLRSAGLTLRAKVEKDGDEVKTPGWLGVNLKGATVSTALAGGPAEQAGLYAGDEIVAVNGFRADDKGLAERLAARRPGDRVRVAFFRRDELGEVEVTLGEKPPTWEIVPAEHASENERALRAQWLGEDAGLDEDQNRSR